MRSKSSLPLTDKTAPKVTERKYHSGSHQAVSFFYELGFKVQGISSLVYKEEFKETPKKLIIETHRDEFVLVEGEWVYSGSFIDTRSEKKQWCVGGPLAGQLKSISQAKEYTAFNNAYNRGNSKLTTVLIWNTLLEDASQLN